MPYAWLPEAELDARQAQLQIAPHPALEPVSAWLFQRDSPFLSVGGLPPATSLYSMAVARDGFDASAVDAFRARAITLAWTNRKIRAAIIGYLGHMWELFVLWAWIGAAATASFAMTMPEEGAVSLGKLAAFMCVAAGAPACIWGGALADRIGKARVAAAALLISGSAAILTALSFGGPVWLTLVLVVIWGAAVIPDSPQFSAIVADNAPPELVGSLVTFQASLGFLLTAFTVQVAPMVAEMFGWPVLLSILAAGPIVGLIGMRPLFTR